MDNKIEYLNFGKIIIEICSYLRCCLRNVKSQLF